MAAVTDNVRPFCISIPDELLDTTKAKLRLARIDEGMGQVAWNDLEIGHQKLKDIIVHWRDHYDWKTYERYLNSFNHFKTSIPIHGFDDIDLHFLHHKSEHSGAVPLIFVHGWPGSFLESLKIIPLLTNPPTGRQAFHVVAPSIPGYGFSGYSRKSGFGLTQHAECFARLMARLGYNKYVCQGGDWGSSIVRYMALNFPDNVEAIHINMFLALPPEHEENAEDATNQGDGMMEVLNMKRTNWFATAERGYQRIQETKAVTLGYAFHDSPVGQLAWFAGKLKAWTDDYPWTADEIIHWAFIHYQGSTSAAMRIYEEASEVLNGSPDSMLARYISQPVGGSLFPRELWLYPRKWMEATCNIQYWKQHSSGGHFIAWERPEALAEDVAEFFGGLPVVQTLK